MNLKKTESEMKNCGTSCGCDSNKKKEAEAAKTVEIKAEKEQKLDPTYFGDWQVNCRTIDF